MLLYRLRLSVPFAGLVALTCGCTVYSLLVANIINDTTSFICLTIILIVYLLLEIKRTYSTNKIRFFINPVVLCTFMTFILYYGITNIIYFFPEKCLLLIGLKPQITPAMSKLMLVVIVGATGMWIGYWSSLAMAISRSSYLTVMKNRYFTYNVELKDWALIFLISIGLFSRLLSVALGVYGYSTGYEQSIRAAAYTQYLTLGSYFSNIAFTVVTLQYYSHPPSLKNKVWFISLLIVEEFFGFLSGYKKLITLPFFIVILCQYIIRGKVSKIWPVWICIGFLAGYAVIEPFRIMRAGMDNFDSTSISSIITTMVKSVNSVDKKQVQEVVDETSKDVPVVVRIMARTNLAQIGSYGIEFKDTHNVLPPGSPNFLNDILLSPLYSWIPRFLWSGKTLQNIGLWYTQVIMGETYLFSSTAMGMFTYLYFAGGFLAVFLGFGLIGCLQRMVFEIAQPWKTSAGALVALSTVTVISVIAELNMDALIVLLCRMLVIILILQKVIYKHKISRGYV